MASSDHKEAWSQSARGTARQAGFTQSVSNVAYSVVFWDDNFRLRLPFILIFRDLSEYGNNRHVYRQLRQKPYAANPLKYYATLNGSVYIPIYRRLDRSASGGPSYGLIPDGRFGRKHW